MQIREMLKKRWVKLLLEIGFFIILFLLLRAYMQKDMVSGPAPQIQAKTLAGQQFDLSAADKPILVHFWATWCGICKLEQGSIQSISADYPVITVAMQSGDDMEVQAYLDEHQLSFPVINDVAGDISASFGVYGVPASFIVNRDGEIVTAERGYTTGWGLRARLWLAK